MCNECGKQGSGCGCGCGKKSQKPTCQKITASLFAGTPKRICHNLCSECVQVQAHDSSTGQLVLVDWKYITGNDDCIEVTVNCDMTLTFTIQK